LDHKSGTHKVLRLDWNQAGATYRKSSLEFALNKLAQSPAVEMKSAALPTFEHLPVEEVSIESDLFDLFAYFRVFPRALEFRDQVGGVFLCQILACDLVCFLRGINVFLNKPYEHTLVYFQTEFFSHLAEPIPKSFLDLDSHFGKDRVVIHASQVGLNVQNKLKHIRQLHSFVMENSGVKDLIVVLA
jgi:hypothetical protein